MGAHFFQKTGPGRSPQIGGGSQNLEARAMGTEMGAARGAGIGAQKALGGALFKPNFKKSTGTAAYPPGPKKT